MRKTDTGFLITTLTLSVLQAGAWLSWQQHHCRSAIPYETPISSFDQNWVRITQYRGVSVNRKIKKKVKPAVPSENNRL